MSDEIVIKTETVNVSDLQGREKQIYEYAYRKGYGEAIDENKLGWYKLLFKILVVVIVAGILVGLYFSENQRP